MKLAEALAERADAARRVEQLRARIVGSARYQEGEAPAEDAQRLLAEVGTVLDELEALIRRINRTNAAVAVGDAGTLTDALARRDVLRLRHAVITAAADAAAGKDQRVQRGFDSPQHRAAQHGAQVTVHSAQHTTMCRSTTARVGQG